jgi:hypothetical protein
MNDINLINRTFNELTIKDFISRPDTKKYRALNTNNWVHCKCSCGNEVDLPLCGVKNGFIKSCGCLRIQQAKITLEKVRKNNPTPTAVYLTYEDKTMNISEWSKETGIPRTTIMYRMNKGMSIDKILERKKKNE